MGVERLEFAVDPYHLPTVECGLRNSICWEGSGINIRDEVVALLALEQGVQLLHVDRERLEVHNWVSARLLVDIQIPVARPCSGFDSIGNDVRRWWRRRLLRHARR